MRAGCSPASGFKRSRRKAMSRNAPDNLNRSTRVQAVEEHAKKQRIKKVRRESSGSRPLLRPLPLELSIIHAGCFTDGRTSPCFFSFFFFKSVFNMCGLMLHSWVLHVYIGI